MTLRYEDRRDAGRQLARASVCTEANDRLRRCAIAP